MHFSVTTEGELGALTRKFNAMAEELRNFYRKRTEKLLNCIKWCGAMMTTLPYPLFILGNSNQMTRSNPAAERLMDLLNAKGELPLQVRRNLEEAVITGVDYRLDDRNWVSGKRWSVPLQATRNKRVFLISSTGFPLMEEMELDWACRSHVKWCKRTKGAWESLADRARKRSSFAI